MRIGTMTSSNGEVDFNADTGYVLEVRSANAKYENYLFDIVRVDVDEWNREYPGEDIANYHDVLDFGTWDRFGIYEKPCLSWRRDRRTRQNEEKQRNRACE